MPVEAGRSARDAGEAGMTCVNMLRPAGLKTGRCTAARRGKSIPRWSRSPAPIGPKPIDMRVTSGEVEETALPAPEAPSR